MPITVTLKQIVDARDSLMSISQQKLPIKPAYNISKIIRKANQELETLTQVRQDVISRHAPQGTEITPEINQAIMTELNEALDIAVEIPVNKVDLSRVAEIEISARDVLLLEPFCEFEDTALE
jgi:hypothetical protein